MAPRRWLSPMAQWVIEPASRGWRQRDALARRRRSVLAGCSRLGFVGHFVAELRGNVVAHRGHQRRGAMAAKTRRIAGRAGAPRVRFRIADTDLRALDNRAAMG